jgi:SAM-dependent methyltransferase
MMAEYVDFAEYYDGDHDFTQDIGFYLDYARNCGSPILELACGTGRVLVPLAEAGCEILGLDISENMLAVCRRKVGEKGLLERVRLVQADMTSFELEIKDFSLAFLALRSFMHLLTQPDQQACLECVHRHLRPGGCLIVTLIAPDLEKLTHSAVGPFELRREFDLPGGIHVIRKERLVEHDHLNQVRRFEFKFEEFDANGAILRERVVPLATRYTFRFELQLLLERTGFELVDLYRDYNGYSYNGTGEMIAVARKRSMG